MVYNICTIPQHHAVIYTSSHTPLRAIVKLSGTLGIPSNIHKSLLLSQCTHKPLGKCVYWENTSDKWNIPCYTMRKLFRTFFIPWHTSWYTGTFSLWGLGDLNLILPKNIKQCPKARVLFKCTQIAVKVIPQFLKLPMNFLETLPECSLPSSVSKNTIKIGHHACLKDAWIISVLPKKIQKFFKLGGLGNQQFAIFYFNFSALTKNMCKSRVLLIQLPNCIKYSQIFPRKWQKSGKISVKTY